MNRYSDKYNFRLAHIEDVDKIMSFIKSNWREGHILANNKEFFLYEHGNESNINFIICEEKSTGTMVGMHGFIPYSDSCNENYHVCGVLTMVSGENLMPMLGVELIKRFIEITNYKTYCGIGTNSKTMVPIAERLFRRVTGIMQHYYMINDLSEYKVAVIENKKYFLPISQNMVVLQKIEDINQCNSTFNFEKKYYRLPYKSKAYIDKRYFHHPIYRYHKWKVLCNDEMKGLLIAKVITINERKIMRIIDFIGDISAFKHIGESLKSMLIEEKYEYIDCFSNGLDQRDMEEAGFALIEKGDKNIIPNYFEPFVHENIEIWFESSEKDMVLFKGDADADRPNASC